MLWVEEQRAIAELMILRDGDLTLCLGFAAFAEKFDEKFDRWFNDFAAALPAEPLPRKRLTDLFDLLLVLGSALDPLDLRYEWREWQERDAAGRLVGKLNKPAPREVE